VLEDYERAPIADGLRATLRFLDKMTMRPDELGPADAEAVYAAGVSRAALEDAVYVCANFSIIVRLAEAFEFHVPTDAEFLASAKQLLKRGYRG
jgi:hypothetical protein